MGTESTGGVAPDECAVAESGMGSLGFVEVVVTEREIVAGELDPASCSEAQSGDRQARLSNPKPLWLLKSTRHPHIPNIIGLGVLLYGFRYRPAINI